MGGFNARIDGLDLAFDTAPRLFSPRGIDRGTAAMLRQSVIDPQDKILDLGCGYGLVGIYAAHRADPRNVWLSDIDPLAVQFARRNLALNGIAGATALVSDGFDAIGEAGFTKILCNPPYHVDFSLPKRLIEKGFNRLAIGGSMILVVKRDAWYRNKLRAIFGNARASHDDEYIVFQATRRSTQYGGGTRQRT